jgi:hypothetical protein
MIAVKARHGQPEHDVNQSVIRNKPAPDLIRGGTGFPKKIMLH